MPNSTPPRAVTTYDFNNINLTLYPSATTIALSPQQCIMLAQQLLTNALLCTSHKAQVRQPDDNSVPEDTTPTSAVA